MRPKKDNKMYFPFMSHHEWYGFEDAEDLVAFLEDGVYPKNAYIDREEVEELKMLPPPDTTNGKNTLLDSKGKPIVRTRGNAITEIIIPVKKEKSKVIEETKLVKVGQNSEVVEIIREDIAQGGNGG